MYVSQYVVVNTFVGGRQPQNKLMQLRTFKKKMLLYVEDLKREKESQGFERFKTAFVQGAANSAFVAPEQLEEPGHTVCVGASHSPSARGLAHCSAHVSS